MNITKGRLSWKGKYAGKEVSITQPSTKLVGPGGSDGKESTCNMGDLGLIPADRLKEQLVKSTISTISS